MNKNLPEASGEHVFGGLGGTITNAGHNIDTLESPPDSVVNTFWLPPVAGKLVVAITLVTSELFRPLLDDLGLGSWSNRHGAATTGTIKISYS